MLCALKMIVVLTCSITWEIMYAMHTFCASSSRFHFKNGFWLERKFPKTTPLPALKLHFLEPLPLIPDRHRLLMLKTIYIKCKWSKFVIKPFWRAFNWLCEHKSQKRSTFENLRLFIVHSLSIHLALITHSFAFCVHKAFSVGSSWDHKAFAKHSLFTKRSLFIVLWNSKLAKSISRN